MIVIGLTGSIGMGKSTTASMLEQMGIPVHEADEEVHDLLKPDGKARAALAAAFPYFRYPHLYDRKTKEIKRNVLGEIVFKNEKKRKKLESILHPFVREAQNKFVLNARKNGRDVVALDIPLLFETGADQNVDYTINVSAPYFVQRQRVLERPDMNEKKFQAVLKAQMPDAEKCERADFIVHTGLGRAQALKELKKALTEIQEDHV